MAACAASSASSGSEPGHLRPDGRELCSERGRAGRRIAAEPWREDRKLLELLGVRGVSEFRALFDGFPEAVGCCGQ
jgi:hypothetical protein